MNSGMEAITTTALSLALDAATLRHQVIATNLANAGSAGFVPRRATFEALVSQGQQAAAGGVPPLSAGLQVRVEPDLTPEGTPRDVHVDAEAAALAENSLHYQALVRGLSRHLGILASAVTEGKR